MTSQEGDAAITGNGNKLFGKEPGLLYSSISAGTSAHLSWGMVIQEIRDSLDIHFKIHAIHKTLGNIHPK